MRAIVVLHDVAAELVSAAYRDRGLRLAVRVGDEQVEVVLELVIESEVEQRVLRDELGERGVPGCGKS